MVFNCFLTESNLGFNSLTLILIHSYVGRRLITSGLCLTIEFGKALCGKSPGSFFTCWGLNPLIKRLRRATSASTYKKIWPLHAISELGPLPGVFVHNEIENAHWLLQAPWPLTSSKIPVTRATLAPTQAPWLLACGQRHWTQPLCFLLAAHQGSVWDALCAAVGFPGGTSGKTRLPMQEMRSERPGFDPWVWKIPWRRAWQPTPGFCVT